MIRINIVSENNNTNKTQKMSCRSIKFIDRSARTKTLKKSGVLAALSYVILFPSIPEKKPRQTMSSLWSVH